MGQQLPRREKTLGVIGGRELSVVGVPMAQLLGAAIVEAGYVLITGGRRGAGEAASLGAVGQCRKRGLDPLRWVIAMVPFETEPGFHGSAVIHAGSDRFERRMVLMNSVLGVFVIGGTRGTESEIMHAAVNHYMGYETTARVIPVAGTGGVADRILAVAHGYNDPVLDDPMPSVGKAETLVAKATRIDFPVHEYWGVDLHEGWLRGDPHPAVRETCKIRHYDYSQILVEGSGPRRW